MAYVSCDEKISPRKARDFLQSLGVQEEVVLHVENILSHISFKGGSHEQVFKSPELDVVQDADRLDAMGAIGIARTFNYGGYKKRELYNPDIKPNLHMTKEEYKNSTAPTLNHFYKKRKYIFVITIFIQSMETKQNGPIPEMRSHATRIESPETEEKKYTLVANQEFIDFRKIEVTKIDKTKPWEPALEVSVIKSDGTIVENLDANTSFFTFRDLKGNEMTVSAATAGHIDQLHIKGEDEGSKFDYSSLEALFEDVAKKLPMEVASAPGVSDFALEMGRHMGKEGVASMEELKAEGILSEIDIRTAESVRAQVQELNMSGDETSKNVFIEQFKTSHPDCKIQFQLVRGTVLVPTVDIPKRDTTELFVVFGPGADGKKTAYTMAPGRHMPRHPNPNQHKSPEGVLNEETFKESADAWFDTVILTGK